MKKILYSLGGLLILITSAQSITYAQTTTYPNTAPEDAAKINDIQGQVNSSYFQNNSLKQDATGVTQNSSGVVNLLKNSNDQQVVKVIGPVPTEDKPSNNNDVPIFGLAIFFLVMLAPIFLIINMLKNSKQQTKPEPANASPITDYSQVDEEITDAEINKLNQENIEPLELEEVKVEEPEPIEKLKEKTKSKPTKKHKKKSKKRKKR